MTDVVAELNLSRFSAQMRALIGLATRMGWRPAHTRNGGVILTAGGGTEPAQVINVPPGGVRDGFAVAGLNKAITYAPDRGKAARIQRAREAMGKRAKSPESLLKLYDLVSSTELLMSGQGDEELAFEEYQTRPIPEVLDRITAEIEQMPIERIAAERDEAGVPDVPYELRAYPRPVATGGTILGGVGRYFRDSLTVEQVEWSDGHKTIRCSICGQQLAGVMGAGPHRRREHPELDAVTYNGKPMWQGPADLMQRLDQTTETLQEILDDYPRLLGLHKQGRTAEALRQFELPVAQRHELPEQPDPEPEAVEPEPVEVVAAPPSPAGPVDAADAPGAARREPYPEAAATLDAIRQLLDGGETARLRERVAELEAQLAAERTAREALQSDLDALGSMLDGLRGR